MEKILERETENEKIIGHLILKLRKVGYKINDIENLLNDIITNSINEEHDIFNTTNGRDESAIYQLKDKIATAEETLQDLWEYLENKQDEYFVCENCDHCDCQKIISENETEYNSFCKIKAIDLGDEPDDYRECKYFCCSDNGK